MTDRELLAVARHTLDEREFRVWFAKHYQDLGRRSGSVALGISEDSWRYRLACATRKLDAALQAQEAA